jgi:hypothetical protein
MEVYVTATAEAVKERPILFSGPMVKAILAGQKTQTRRIVKFNHKPWRDDVLPTVEYARDGMPIWWDSPPPQCIRDSDYYDHGYPCPYGKPGERLWVRETFNAMIDPGARKQDVRRKVWNREEKETEYWVVDYKADGGHGRIMDLIGQRKWQPSIFMPRWASRITLEVTGVRVERLHDITEADAETEGFHRAGCGGEGNVRTFARTWDQINGPESWAANPWVWVVSFKRIEATQ